MNIRNSENRRVSDGHSQIAHYLRSVSLLYFFAAYVVFSHRLYIDD